MVWSSGSVQRACAFDRGGNAGRPARFRFVSDLRVLACALPLTIAGQAGAAPLAELPPPRPSEFGGTTPPATEPASPQPPPSAPAAEVAPSQATTAERRGGACLSRLRAAGWIVEIAPQPTPDRTDCRIDAPVRLSALRDPGAAAGAVQLPDRPVVACRFAEIFGEWLGGVLVPAAAVRLGSPLSAVQTGPGHECRTRDRIEGAKVSAHALGQAIDVAALSTADGKRHRVEPSPANPDWAETFGTVRTAACGWFLTVLGPGSDPYHSDHLHLDIQKHGSSERYRICQ